jgi:hypothetical protein
MSIHRPIPQQLPVNSRSSLSFTGRSFTCPACRSAASALVSAIAWKMLTTVSLFMYASTAIATTLPR